MLDESVLYVRVLILCMCKNRRLYLDVHSPLQSTFFPGSEVEIRTIRANVQILARVEFCSSDQRLHRSSLTYSPGDLEKPAFRAPSHYLHVPLYFYNDATT